METGAVEAQLHGTDNIVLQGFFGGGGVNAVGIEPLIENETTEEGLAVESQQLFAVTLGDPHRAKSKVGTHGILARA